MAHIQYFKIQREIDGETVELELQAECEITGDTAHISGPIFVRDDDGELRLWKGSLTEEEEEEIAHDARDAWFEISDDSFDDEELLDSEYDSFDSGAIRVGNGKLFY